MHENEKNSIDEKVHHPHGCAKKSWYLLVERLFILNFSSMKKLKIKMIENLLMKSGLRRGNDA